MGWRVDDELQQMLRDSARNYLGDAGGPGHFRNVRNLESGFDAVAWAQMGELGWTGVLLPEAVGGSGLGLASALTLAEELGRTLAPEPFVSAGVIAATLLANSESGAATALAGDLAQGARSVTLAWQEEPGSIGMPKIATRIAQGRLTGRKLYVPAWHAETALLVAASDGSGAVVAVVDPASSGVKVRSARMNDGTFAAELDFDNVVVAGDAVILSGLRAAELLDLALARGAVALSAQLEGMASALWQLTVGYMQQRSQFDSKLSEFQALRHRMVDLFSEVELAAASWRRAAEVVERGEGFGASLHAAKARCSQVAQDMGRWAIQYHGAFGYTDEADVGLYVHSGLRWSTWLGNASAHRRAALSAHRSTGGANG